MKENKVYNLDPSLAGYSEKHIKMFKVYLTLLAVIEIGLGCLAITKGSMFYFAPFVTFIIFSIIGRIMLNCARR